MRVLAHPDVEVRIGGLGFVGANSIRAPALQIPFSGRVFDRAIELSRSPNARERVAAISALDETRDYDHAAFRRRMMQLCKDESERVRSSALFALRHQADRADVRALFVALLRDQSARVRVAAIVCLGPEKYVSQLREIAAGGDAEAADHAASYLSSLKARSE